MTLCKDCCWWSPNRPEIGVDKEKLCLNPKLNIVTDDEFGCTLAVPSDSVEVNVPNHTPDGMNTFRNDLQVDGPVEILIVTYAKDFQWLHYALGSIEKFLTGFQGVTIAHPIHESELFNSLHNHFDVRLHPYQEEQGKGMIQHMAKMAEAELIVPAGTKYVLHSDSDCIFKMPTTPEDYFYKNKPYYLIRPWDSLTEEDPKNPGSKVVSDCLQWRVHTEFQLGFPSPWYTMCMNTAVIPISFYKPYREHVSKVHRKPFMEYMLSGKNSHPASRMDWTAMGCWAYHYMHDSFFWFDVTAGPYPSDRKQAFWSHGGINAATRARLEQILSEPVPASVGYVASPEEVERMAQ